MDGRFVIEGKLGCPICSSSFPIRNGIADFGSNGPIPLDSDPEPATEEMTLRVAGMLGLTRAGAAVVLSRLPAEIASAVAALTSVKAISVNPISYNTAV